MHHIFVVAISRLEVRTSSNLGRYSSLFSLQCLDRLGLVAIACANGTNTVVEASKFELLVQLNRKLIDGDRGVSDLALDLDGDQLSEGLSTWTAEGHHDGVNLLRVSNDVRDQGQGHLKRGRGLTLDFLLNRHVEDLNRHLETGLLISKSESAAEFPGPVGVVKNINLDDFGGAWSHLDNVLRLAGADGAGLFPVLLALEVPVLVASTAAFVVLPFLLELFELLLDLFVIEVADEFVDHVLEATASSATAASTTSAASVMATTTSELADHLLNEGGGVTASLGFFLRGLFLWQHSDHDIWCATGLTDLEEGVLVVETLLALGAVVEVLADGALVAQANNWSDVAAIAANIGVDSLWIEDILIRSGQLIRLEKRVEDALRLSLELLYDQVLESLARNALGLILLSAFGFASCRLGFIFHLFVLMLADHGR